MSENDAIPEFKRPTGAGSEVGITGGMSALAAGPGIRSVSEVLAIVLVAVVIIGGTELLLTLFHVPQYVLPRPSEIAVALASGPMVMINAATGFRRVDSGKIALARSYGASTLQIFWKVRAPMALPMIFVGLMVGSIFGLLTAVGAEMVGGGFGLGNRLTSYSSMIQMPQFFAVVLILSILGILIYVLFFLLGKKFASWEA